MKTLYVRVADSAHSWIAATAARTGLSMANVVELVIREARDRGWHIQVTPARIEDTERSPADESPVPGPRDQGQAPDPEPEPEPPLGTPGPDPHGDAI